MNKKIGDLFGEDIGGPRERELASSVELSESPCKNRFLDEVKNYLVDTTAAVLFYTPVMGSMEYFIAGMDSKEVLHARVFGAACNLVLMRPFGKFREWYANLWNAVPESSQLKKLLVDTTGLQIFWLPVYAGILYYSGSSSKEIAVALPMSVAGAAATARPFGYFWDNYRKFWGTKPVLDK